jgi:lysophospholipase L1-like esterase
MGPSPVSHEEEEQNFLPFIEGRQFPDGLALERSKVEWGDSRRFASIQAKLRNKEVIRVGFIGGSITEGAGADQLSRRYSSLVTTQLQDAFPGSTFIEINAGIGATNSRFASARMDEDLLSQNPDLIILDFAVNDTPLDSTETLETFEAVIRKGLFQGRCPVVVFQALNSLGDEGNHRLQRRLAQHYSLPVISYREACWPLIQAKSLDWQRVAVDAVHPNDTGHAVIAELLYDYLVRAFLSPDLEPIKTTPSSLFDSASIPAPYTSDYYTRSRILHVADSIFLMQAQGGWDIVLDEKGRVQIEATQRDSTLTIAIPAKGLSLGYQVSLPLNGMLEVGLDGRVVDTLSNHFPQDWGGGSMRLFSVFRESENRLHSLTLRLLEGDSFPIPYLISVD